MSSLQSGVPEHIDFLEAAPENWLGVGGRLGQAFIEVTSQRPLVCHGLVLNLGGPDPLDYAFLARLKTFLDERNAVVYGDHLTFCADRGHLYELLPIPFTDEAVAYVAARIRTVQDVLERRIAIENASYYLTLSSELDELTFVRAVVQEADCDLLLDINNVYVNSINHGYDPRDFLLGLPAERIAYAHIAGHAREAADLLIDTHGCDVAEPVWALLNDAYAQLGVFPTLLERDLDIPPLGSLTRELERIRELQQIHAPRAAVAFKQ